MLNVSDIIIPIALMLFSGYALTRVTKRLRLPNVTAYIVAGIIIGPYCLNLVDKNIIEGTDFIADIALAFIAFSTGEFFKFSTLKKNGMKVVIITFWEAFMASLLVFILSFYILNLNLPFSLVLSALALLNVSPLLGCMSMGTVYINITEDDKLFKQINYFSPPILLLFFVRSGLNFKLDVLVNKSTSIGSIPLIWIGMLYFLVRIFGKYIGAFLGSLVTKKSKEVRNYLGLALIPQAGVAIGLSALGARILGGETGNPLQTIILASSVLYELIGPACAKLSLYLSKSYSNKLEDLTSDIEIEPEKKQSEVELLIQRIQEIQKELPRHTKDVSEEEEAFLEAAEEQCR